MAKLKLTTDADVLIAEVTILQSFIPRIRHAFGRFVGAPPVWVDVTAQELLEILKGHCKGRVVEYETAEAANAKRGQVGGESW